MIKRNLSTSAIPPWLIATTISLLILQFAVTMWDFHHLSAPQEKIAWIDTASAKDKQKSSLMTLYYFQQDDSSPCKQLEQTTFQNRKVIDLINTSLVPVKCTDKAKKGGNFAVDKALQARYSVQLFPEMVIALPSGERVFTATGFQASHDLIQALNQALTLRDYVEGKALLKKDDYLASQNHFRKYLEATNWRGTFASYSAIFGCIALIQSGNEADASTFAQESLDKNNDQAWPRPVLCFLAGKLKEDELWKQAQIDHGKLTEATYYLGVLGCARGNLAEGRKNLEWVAEHGDRDYEEYELSLAKLKSIQ